jgi:hypothetical protein
MITTKNNRFFAFGCSFTKYFWPTWADLVATNFIEGNYYNYGQAGMGNNYVHDSLMYADQFHKINKDDVVIICWSEFHRKDFFVEGKWRRFHDADSAIEWWDPTGYLISDISLIKSAKILLEYIGCKYYFLSLADISKPYRDDHVAWWSKNTENSPVPLLLDSYSDIVYPIIGKSFNNMFGHASDIGHNRSHPLTKELSKLDSHPLVDEHFRYIQSVLPNSLLPDSLLVDDLYKKTLELLGNEMPKKDGQWQLAFNNLTVKNYWGIQFGYDQRNKIYEEEFGVKNYYDN